MSMVRIGYWDPVNQRVVRTDGGAVNPVSPQATQAGALPAMQRPSPQTQAIIPRTAPQAATTAAPQAQAGARILAFPRPAASAEPPATAVAPPPAAAAAPTPTAWTLPPEDALGAPVALPQVQPPWLPSTWRLASIRPIVREVTVISNLDPVECADPAASGSACSLVARAGNVLVTFEKVRRPGEFRYGIAIGLADQSSRSRIVSLLSDGVPLTGSVNSPSRAFRILDVERQTIAPDPTPVPPPQSTVAVPDVTNRPAAEAHAALVAAGLMVAPHGTDGTATGTDPPAGTLVTAGSQVALLLAVPAPIPTPSPMGVWIGLGVIGLFALAKMGRRGEGRPLMLGAGDDGSDDEAMCPHCHGRFALERSGRLPVHAEDVRSPKRCAGSGQLPRSGKTESDRGGRLLGTGESGLAGSDDYRADADRIAREMTDMEQANLRRSWEKAQPQRAYPDWMAARYADVRERRNFYAIDWIDSPETGRGSGRLLIDRETGEVWPVAGYGRPNLRYRLGNARTFTYHGER